MAPPPIHSSWNYYCLVRTGQMKLVLLLTSKSSQWPLMTHWGCPLLFPSHSLHDFSELYVLLHLTVKVKSNQTEVARLECVLLTALEKKVGMELPAQTKAGQNLRTRWVEKVTV